MANTTKVIIAGLVLLLVTGGVALSPLGGSVPGSVYGTLLVLMVVALLVGVRGLNRRVDDLDSDDQAKRSTSVWLASALSVRHGSRGAGGSSGELLAGPRGGDRVAGDAADVEPTSGRAKAPGRGGSVRRGSRRRG